ncbi:alpha/beta hydrolase [Candidatus Saccharibacteria bacterium]|nr:alpha/beta hydrolase [Candidatus Saccharibacteria bacterium]
MKIFKLDSGIKYAKFNVAGTKRPVLVMNGWSVSIKTMRLFVRKLAKALPQHPIFVISTDSALYEQPDKRSYKVAALKNVIECLKVDKIHIVAHSEASVTASHYAASNHDKIASLQLIGPAGLTILNATELKAGLLLKIRQDGWQAIFGPVPFRIYMRLLLGGIKQFTLRFKHTRKEWRADPLDNSVGHQLIELQNYKIPTKIIVFKQDEIFKLEQVKTELRILGYKGRLVELGGSHDELIYKPASSIKEIADFIN